MPIGTALHARTAALNVACAWRDWAGYFAASSYEPHHEHEYNAIRQSSALIDVSPLFKYHVAGQHAARLLDRILTRDVHKLQVGQVGYTHWCDGDGRVLDDGTVTRLEPDLFRLTAAEPNLRWLHENALGLDVCLTDMSERTASLALQGPTSRALLAACVQGDVSGLRYFRSLRAELRGIPLEITRTGYTGDLGYELWVARERATELWDALMEEGRAFGIKPAGMLALDVARIEAGLILLDVDYQSARKAPIASQCSTPYELGLGRLVQLDKPAFVGQAALRGLAQRPPARQLVGLEIDWNDLERLHDEVGLPPQVSATASRVAVPVYRDGLQVGRATSTTWSPTLKKLIALGTLRHDASAPGTRLSLELTVDSRRREAGALVVPLPFYDPPRKRA